MTSAAQVSLPSITLSHQEVFPGSGNASEYLTLDDWSNPVTLFVGRNGSGKSKVAKAIAQRLNGKILLTDRLFGLTSTTNYGWASVPNQEASKGIPIADQERGIARGFFGMALDDLYALREQPEVWLKVAAFLRRTLGRTVELREQAGFLDPYVRVGALEYSLLRDEGHGLRELVILLTAAYRQDWQLLVVDEPELHLHPSLARLWFSELKAECKNGRRAIIVTHEPGFVRPKSLSDLTGVWLFAPARPPARFSSFVREVHRERMRASLTRYPELVSKLVFSPRPVLVEGSHDVAAFSEAALRVLAPEQVAQTDFVECGGTAEVALWHEICIAAALDHRAVADLDALFTSEVQRAVDAVNAVEAAYIEEFKVSPAKTSAVLRPLLYRMNKEEVPANEKQRALWLASLDDGGTGTADVRRRDEVLRIWRDFGQVWLHPQGTLEQVLGLTNKGPDEARTAASSPSRLDAVCVWCAYSLDTAGDVRLLLGIEVERIAQEIMRALRADPAATFTAPIGPSRESDARLVTIKPVDGGKHRIEVLAPAEYAGYWLEFDRDTPSSALVLEESQDDGSSQESEGASIDE